MKRIFFIIGLLLTATIIFAGSWKNVNRYKKINSEGYSNCVFATKAISKGKERSYTLKTTFTKPEKVYARCYFPGKVGRVKAENFWHEIWIDGKMRMRTRFKKPPGAAWKQSQVWITEDEYKKQMRSLGKGKHTIIIWFIKNEYKGRKKITERLSSGKIVTRMKEVWVPKRLSKGTFTYIVP